MENVPNPKFMAGKFVRHILDMKKMLILEVNTPDVNKPVQYVCKYKRTGRDVYIVQTFLELELQYIPIEEAKKQTEEE